MKAEGFIIRFEHNDKEWFWGVHKNTDGYSDFVRADGYRKTKEEAERVVRAIVEALGGKVVK